MSKPDQGGSLQFDNLEYIAIGAGLVAILGGMSQLF